MGLGDGGGGLSSLGGRAAVVVPATFYLWFAGRHAVAVGFFISAWDSRFLFEYGLKPRLMARPCA